MEFLFGPAYAGLQAAFHLEGRPPGSQLPVASQLACFVLELSKQAIDPAPEGICPALAAQVCSSPAVLERVAHSIFLAPWSWVSPVPPGSTARPTQPARALSLPTYLSTFHTNLARNIHRCHEPPLLAGDLLDLWRHLARAGHQRCGNEKALSRAWLRVCLFAKQEG
jgi:hypothetical protein